MDIKEIIDGFSERAKQGFNENKGKPLVKAEILDCCEPGRPLFARTYSYSVINFAMRVFWLGEEEYYDTANEALIENCDVYIDHKECRDDRDSFYWSIDVFTRIVEFFGKNGTIAPGRLSEAAEKKFIEMSYCWCKNNSDPAKAEFKECKTWNVWESENHHIQTFSTAWHLSKLMMADEHGSARVYDDGRCAESHYKMWSEYIKQWLSERAKKSLFVESANGDYACETLKGVYNIYDFTDDTKMKELAKNLLDLYWATWAEEQINGVRGGGKTRVYPDWLVRGEDGLKNWAYYTLGIGTLQPVHHNDYTIMTSTYRPDDIVAELAYGKKGTYEIKSRPLGLAKPGYYLNPDYRLRTDWGGIYRYSYVTEHFIIGTLMAEAHDFEDWTLISSQNRFQGVIFSSDKDARIAPVPQCMASDSTPIMRSYNQHYSVQSKGTLITRKLNTSVDVGTMRVWFSNAGGVSNITEENGWIFSKTDGAYAAVKVIDGGYTVNKEEKGLWVECEKEYSPVILEVADISKYESFDEFKTAIFDTKLKEDNSGWYYTSIYGDDFVFYKDFRAMPVINGKESVQQIGKAFESPYIDSDWNSGIVRIRYGESERVLDFTV